jgi:hypothetical protein
VGPRRAPPRPSRSTLDEAWNALGRPASSIEYTLIAGRGKSQWTDGDPRLQPILMTILAARFRQSTAAVLQAGKEGWAQRVEAKAADQLGAATKLQAAEATLMGATGIARGVADLAQVALARFKRDLTNAGLTEAQIHDIIPSYEPKPHTPPAAAKPAGAPPAGTSGAFETRLTKVTSRWLKHRRRSPSSTANGSGWTSLREPPFAANGGSLRSRFGTLGRSGAVGWAAAVRYYVGPQRCGRRLQSMPSVTRARPAGQQRVPRLAHLPHLVHHPLRAASGRGGRQ